MNYNENKIFNKGKRILGLLPLFLSLLLCLEAGAALNGTYTINATAAASSTNYRTFASAVSDMASGTRADGGTPNGTGVSGPVTFNVANGTYSEQVTIPAITGASATNRITFQSASGDSSLAILEFASSATTGNNYALALDGADYITFRKLTIQRTGTATYANVIDIKTAATNNQFFNNRIIGVVATSSTTNRVNIFSTATLDNNNTFRQNLVKYGSYGFYYRGASSTSFETGTVIEDNIIDSAYIYAINLQYQDAPVVRRNKITNNITTTSYGIYLSYCRNGQIIRENRVVFNSGGYGIYPTNCMGTSSTRGLIANNMVSMAGTGTAYGIYLNGSAYQDVIHNNVLITSTSTTGGRGIYVTGGTGDVGNRIINNNFANTGGGVAFEISTGGVTAKMIDTSNYNNLYATGNILATWGATDVTTLTQWKTVSNQDPNSVSADPKYISYSDLHTNSFEINNKAIPFTGVNTDFDGQTRNTATPDIGADEFTPPANNLLMQAIISPVDNSCGDSTTQIRVVIANEGTASQSNFSVVANITGSVTQSTNITYTGTLASGARDTITFPLILNTFSGGTYNITTYTNLSNDENRSNDTLRANVKIIGIPAAPITSDVTICEPISVKLTATAGSGNNLQWFTSANATSPAFTGDTFTTPVISSNTTFYVEATQQTPSRVGPVDNTIGAGGNFTSLTAQRLEFEVFAPITIDSFAVYPNAAGDVYVRLLNSSNTPLDTVIRSVGTAGVKTMIPIGLKLAPGVYRLDGGGSTTGGLYRNSAGAAYQYTVPGVMAITGSSFNVNSYYYYYDWHISTAGCPSPRVPFTVSLGARPSGVSIIQGATFNGKFNAGTANNPDSVCTGNSIIYELNPPTGFSNADFGTTWNVTNISFATANGTAASDTTITAPTATSNGMISFRPVIASADSTYELRITVINMATGCDTIITRFVHVSATPAAGFTSANVCFGKEVQFTNTTSAIRPGATYSWNFGDGNTSDSSNPVHTYAAPGAYTVSLVVRNASGCNDSIAKQVEVYPNPVADFAAISVCSGQSVQFIDSSSITSGSITGRTWYFGDGTTSTDINPSHRYAAIGNYDVKLVVTSANGCMDSITKPVSVFAQPVAGFTTQNVCLGDTAIFTNTSTIETGQLSYLWSFGDGDTSSAENPVHVYSASGTYNVSLLVVSPNQCVDTFTQAVTVFALPNADFTYSVVSGRTYSFAAADTTLVSYLWDFGDSENSAIAKPTHTYTVNGNYIVTLRVRNANGCEMIFSDTVNVIVTGILHAPKTDISLNIFPNPFHAQTNVVYTLEKTSKVNAVIFDISGKAVTVLADKQQAAGQYSYPLNADELKMNAGMYLLRIMVDDALITKQIIRLK